MMATSQIISKVIVDYYNNYLIKFLSILYPNSDHILHVLYFRVSVDVGYHLKRLEIGDKQKATIQLWDIPGNSNWIIDENIYNAKI